MMEIDGKSCFSVKKNYFDQKTACGAPVRWSKYTTHCQSNYRYFYLTTTTGPIEIIIFLNSKRFS